MTPTDERNCLGNSLVKWVAGALRSSSKPQFLTYCAPVCTPQQGGLSAAEVLPSQMLPRALVGRNLWWRSLGTSQRAEEMEDKGGEL